MATLFVGIDPGVAGGIAIIDRNSNVIAISKRPDTIKDVLEFLRAATNLTKEIRGVLEYVRASPQMGVSSAFTFGCGYGELKACLVAAEIPFEEVTPGRWQKVLSCRTEGDKNISKRHAQQLFPRVEKMTHAYADALLIAEYARRLDLGMIPAAPAKRTGKSNDF